MTDATNSTEDDIRAGAPDVDAPGGRTSGSGPGAGAEGDPVESLRAELEEAQALYARARADYANLERRSQEQRFEIGRAAVVDAVRGFLPVLDDLQRAIEVAESGEGGTADAAFVEGVRLVAQKFRAAMDQHGVEEIPALGEPFDPNQHEAVGRAPGPEGQVVQLLQRGYTLRDRVIRPAMVMVGSGEDASTD